MNAELRAEFLSLSYYGSPTPPPEELGNGITGNFVKLVVPAGSSVDLLRFSSDGAGTDVFYLVNSNGRIARLLIGENSPIEKEYLVRVEGRLPPEALKLLNHGLSLDGQPLKPAKVSWQNEDQLRFVLREGKKRQIRRMCELVGLKVIGLKRIRMGRINLGHLPLGQWRSLAPWEKF